MLAHEPVKSLFTGYNIKFRGRFVNPGILLGIRGWGVPLRSPNPDPISDQTMPFSIPVFRSGL